MMQKSKQQKREAIEIVDCGRTCAVHIVFSPNLCAFFECPVRFKTPSSSYPAHHGCIPVIEDLDKSCSDAGSTAFREVLHQP